MSALPTQAVLPDGSIRSLPLVTLHLTDRCNSRCISCDYWRHGSRDVTLESVRQLLPELTALGTRMVLITGGEPLIHPQWMEIARLLRTKQLHLWLVTSGLSLAKHATNVTELFQSVTVSLDGADRAAYAAIRGLDAFDNVCSGIRAVAARGVPVSVRVTIQHANYDALPGLVTLAHELGARQITFLAADVRSTHAFGRAGDCDTNVALRAADLPRFDQVLRALERDHEEDFRSGFIAESPMKLRRLLDYYAAICGCGPFPPTRCNAPEFSAVVEANGRVHPCFFIQGPVDAGAAGLDAALNDEAMIKLRAAIRERQRPECVTCVCSLWRDANGRSVSDLVPAGQAVA